MTKLGYVARLEKTQEVYKQWEANPLVWGWQYFPTHFRSESPEFHFRIVEEALKNQFFAVAAPRGSAKTTLIMFLIPIYYICFKKKHCIVLVGNTYKKAASALETIKKEFRENTDLNRDFGIKITKDAEGDSVFRHPDKFEIHIICKGAEQIGSIRGEKFGAYRPDAIFVDDLEDDTMVKNPELRDNLRDLYDDALIPSVDVSSPYNVFVLGTILHDDSLIARLVSSKHYKNYRKLLYRALNKIDGQEVSLWEEKWSVAWLKELQRTKPSTFAKEYQNDPVSGKEARFTRDQFRYWSIEDGQYVLFNRDGSIASKGSMRECKGAIACDLAWEEQKDKDFTVIMPLYITPNGELLIDNYVNERGMRPDKFCEHLFTIEAKLRHLTGGSVPIGFEKAMLEKVTQWILKGEMRKRNHWLITKELKWETDKIKRIETVLQPRYAQNIIYHKSGMGDLEYQLLRFPSGTHDDLVDGLQGACRLLEYPKNIKVEKKETNDFEWWRRKAIEAKKVATKKKGIRYVFGNKKRVKSIVPFVKGF